MLMQEDILAPGGSSMSDAGISTFVASLGGVSYKQTDHRNVAAPGEERTTSE